MYKNEFVILMNAIKNFLEERSKIEDLVNKIADPTNVNIGDKFIIELFNLLKNANLITNATDEEYILWDWLYENDEEISAEKLYYFLIQRKDKDNNG